MPAIKRQRLDDGTCWAHTQSGTRCGACVEPGAVPYCATHLRAGDGALRRVQHPEPALGFALVARAALPDGYRLCFWGDRTRCSPTDRDDRALQFLSGRDRMNPNGAIDPKAHGGSLGQWMNAPASFELPTARPTGNFFGGHNSAELVGQEFVVTRALAANHQLAFSYSSDWWRRRAGRLKRLPASCARYPLPQRPRKRPSSRDPRARMGAARQRQQERLEALLPLLTTFLPGLGDACPSPAGHEGDGGVLLELNIGVDGGLVRALATACSSGQLAHDIARPVQLLGVARSAAVAQRLAQPEQEEDDNEDEEESGEEEEPGVSWGGSLRALAAATAGGVDVMVGRIQTSLDEDGTSSRAQARAMRAGLGAREQRLAAKEAVDKARANATESALAQATQAGELLRPGGALLLESDSDDEDIFMQWLQMVCPAFGRRQPAAAQLLRSEDGAGPCVWLLRKRAAGVAEGSDAEEEERGDRHQEEEEDEEEEEVDVEIMEY